MVAAYYTGLLEKKYKQFPSIPLEIIAFSCEQHYLT